MIGLEDFNRVELRIGEIVVARPIAGSDRLLAMTVNLGHETRTVVGRIARSYRPEELCGLKVVVVTNLRPAVIKGVESQGMLLGVGCEDDTGISLLTVHRSVSNGAMVR